MPPRTERRRRLAAALGLLLATAGAILAQPLPANLTPGPGRLLVANERLLDPNFVHTVVLLVEADTMGALGLVVNRPTEMPLERVLAGVEAVDEPVWVGGPVEPERVFVLVRSSAELADTVPVFGEVRLGGTQELLARAVAAELPFRVFSGYAGWAPGQLDREIRRGDWYVLEADPDHVFSDDPEALWRSLRLRGSQPWVRLGGRTALRIAP